MTATSSLVRGEGKNEEGGAVSPSAERNSRAICAKSQAKAPFTHSTHPTFPGQSWALDQNIFLLLAVAFRLLVLEDEN